MRLYYYSLILCASFIFQTSPIYGETSFVEILGIILQNGSQGLTVKIVHDIGVNRVPWSLLNSPGLPWFKPIGYDELKRARTILVNGVPGESSRQINDAVPTGYVYGLYFLCWRVKDRPGSGDQMPVIPCVLLAECDRMITKSPFP